MSSSAAPSFWSPALVLAWGIIPLNTVLFWFALKGKGSALYFVCTALCAVQLFAGLGAVGSGVRLVFRAREQGHSTGAGVARLIFGLIGGLGGILGWFGGIAVMGFGGRV